MWKTGTHHRGGTDLEELHAGEDAGLLPAQPLMLDSSSTWKWRT